MFAVRMPIWIGGSVILPGPVDCPTDDIDPPTDCYCHACRMPPCSWCESGSYEGDADGDSDEE